MKPWNNYVQRVVIHATNYLNFDGSYSAGGRQRHIRDLAKLIRDDWGREVLVVQKGTHNFCKSCPDGLDVIGIKSSLGAYGDPEFAYKVSKMIRPSDGLIYASGEDAWPFFRVGSKAIQHGVWWDGPHKLHVRLVQKFRAFGMMRSVRSVLCVDTNFINWLRCQGVEGYQLANKCEYIPNYADIDLIPITERPIGDRLGIITARRYELKRGADLLMDALGILKSTGLDFDAHFSTAGGVAELTKKSRKLNLNENVSISEDTMDDVLNRYKHYHVAVVPTLWSEGTSLACVEAIAAGLPVICTPVGGLGNLVIPGFNGLIVPPTPERIAEALFQCSDKEFLAKMRASSLSMREAFGIDKWKKTVLSWLAT